MELNLADLFEIVVDAVPDRLALVAGETRLTYVQLDRRANQMAHHLAGAGVRPGDCVGIYSWNRAEWLETMLAAFKIRAIPINVNYRYVAEELEYLLDNADVVCLVHERSFAPLVTEVAPALPLLTHRVVLEDGSGHDAGPAVPYEAAVATSLPTRGFAPRSPDDLYVLYTGGTTGMPKGVMWRQEDIFFGALGGGGFGSQPISAPEELGGRVLANTGPTTNVVTPPLMHGGGQWVTFINLYSGNAVALHTGRHFDPHEVWALAEREEAVSVMVVGDAMARPLADALAEPGSNHDLSHLAVFASGGSMLSEAVKDELRRQLPNVLVLDSFGASETGASGSVIDAGDGSAQGRFSMADHTTVLDESMEVVTPGSGIVGRLARRGHIPLGYHKDPEKTAASFRTDARGIRWALPGDAARIESDGTITLLGRGSVSINSGGEKIFPEEVEAAVKSHPSVFDAVVVGVPDTRFGERVVALASFRPGRVATLAELQEHCRARIAGYKVPRQLVVTDMVARTPAGKPDYQWAKGRAMETPVA